MANLDTRSKRASSVQIMAPWALALVLPDGALNLADRQHMAWTYSGLAVNTVFNLTLESRSTGFTLENRSIGFTLENRSIGFTLESR